MGYIIAILVVILAAAFWIAQKNTRKQEAWREQKQRDIAAKRARIAARKTTKTQNSSEEE